MCQSKIRNFKLVLLFSAVHVLKAKGKVGPVDLKVKLAGYNQDVLDRVGVKNAVSAQINF